MTAIIQHQTLSEAANMEIGVFGQQATIQIYTQITYIFEVNDDNIQRRKRIVNVLSAGLARLGASFPWLAGQVVIQGGRYCFAPLDGQAAPQLTVKDLTTADPGYTYAALRDADFSMRMLDETVVAPRRTLPGMPDEAHLADRPVFLVQANFVQGGLLLTFVAHHATMGMSGQGEVIRLLSKACRGEAFTEAELAVGNSKRASLVTPLTDDEGGDDPFKLIPEQLQLSAEEKKSQEAPPESVVCAWSYSDFSAASLAALKTEANATLPTTGPNSHVAFVSTNDAYTAFIWKSIIRARLPRLSPDEPSTMARAIDVCRYMGLPENYIGLMQNMTLHTENVRWVADAPLGHLAAHLRSEIKADRLRLRTRVLATCIDRHPEEAARRIAFVGRAGDTAARGGMSLSSWASVPCTTPDMDFGLGLGVATVVRRPGFTPVESLFYLMPKKADGSIAVALCLREEDLARLRADPVFLMYGRYIG